MRRIVNFAQSNLLPLISALRENTEEGEYTIGMESNAPVGGEYYHVMDDEQGDISENTVISENSTDRRVNSIIKKYSGVSDFNEIRAIRSKILKLIPNARAKNEMYLGAVAMWYLTGCLNDASDRFKLNYLLGRLHHGISFGFEKILGREDFNMVSFDTMKWIMDDIMPSEETAESYSSKGKVQKVGNYTIYRMDSYDDTKYVRSQLSQVHWCIFEDDGTFSYMSEGYTVYVCVRDGYENARMMSYDELVEKLLSYGMTNAVESLEENYPKDDMYDDFVCDIAGDDDETAELLFVDNEYELGLPPCDDYGLSMFVVMVSKETYKNGRVVMVYSRYNLPNMFDGDILSVSELSNVIGADAMSVFTPKKNVQEQKTISENLEFEVDSSEVDLSSFKKQDSLPSIWKDGDTLDSKVRLKLLDIADDFWEYVDVTWVEPKGIIITGSLCNYNWSEFSDVDLHLIVDFNEIDERTDFVKEYLDSKKNEWNEEHGNLKIYGYPVELYVQNIDEDVDAGGVYDLEENKWLRKPSYDDMEEIGAESDDIKEKAARVMTIIDDMWDYFNGTDDSHKLEVLGDDADNLWRKIKKMRTDGLTEDGEMSVGNIVYKYMRRKGYIDRLFDLRTAIYDKVNTITESRLLLGESDQSLDLLALAKERFGTTYDIRECGYILPDGSMLDFSGRSLMEKGSDSSHLRGERHVDHREIYTIGWSEDGNTKNFDIEMNEFIRMGAIRTHVSSSYALLNLFRKPTQEQVNVMLRIIRYAGGCVDVEIGDGYESISSGEYDNANPRRVVGEIMRYFDEGINLMGNVNESVTESTDYEKLMQEEPTEEEYYRAKMLINSTNNIEEYDFYKDIIDRYEATDNLYSDLSSLSARQFLDGMSTDSEYILTNGKMVRLHGHDSVNDIGLSKIGLLKVGNIRIIGGLYSNYVYIELSKYPNEKQVSKLTEYLKTSRGYVYVDITENNELKQHFEFDRKIFSVEMILKKISDYFKNKISEVKEYIKVLKDFSLNEEVVADGSANGNPYAERWKAEREALKNFISNFGTLMQSKEDNKEGRVYKVYYDKLISDLIGYNYCLCVQYDEVKNKPKSTVYVRAYDKFTPFIRRNLQFDDRGLDNLRNTSDDVNCRPF